MDSGTIRIPKRDTQKEETRQPQEYKYLEYLLKNASHPTDKQKYLNELFAWGRNLQNKNTYLFKIIHSIQKITQNYNEIINYYQYQENLSNVFLKKSNILIQQYKQKNQKIQPLKIETPKQKCLQFQLMINVINQLINQINKIHCKKIGQQIYIHDIQPEQKSCISQENYKKLNQAIKKLRLAMTQESRISQNDLISDVYQIRLEFMELKKKLEVKEQQIKGKMELIKHINNSQSQFKQMFTDLQQSICVRAEVDDKNTQNEKALRKMKKTKNNTLILQKNLASLRQLMENSIMKDAIKTVKDIQEAIHHYYQIELNNLLSSMKDTNSIILFQNPQMKQIYEIYQTKQNNELLQKSYKQEKNNNQIDQLKIKLDKLGQQKQQMKYTNKQIEIKYQQLSQEKLLIQKQLQNYKNKINCFEQRQINQKQQIYNNFNNNIKNLQTSNLYLFEYKLISYNENRNKNKLMLQYKTQLKIQIEKYSKKQIRFTRLLYSFDEQNKANFHYYLDERQNWIILVELNNGQIIGGYQQTAIQKKNNQPNKGFIFNLTRKKFYQNKQIVMQNKNNTYDYLYLIVGNADLRIKTKEKKISTNFGSNNSYYQSNGDSVNTFLKNTNGLRQSFINTYEIFQIIFNDQN